MTLCSCVTASTRTEKVDSLTCESLTTFPEVVDSFPKNVDFVRILFTSHLNYLQMQVSDI